MVCVCLNVQNEYAYSFCLLTQVYRRHSGWSSKLIGEAIAPLDVLLDSRRTGAHGLASLSECLGRSALSASFVTRTWSDGAFRALE